MDETPLAESPAPRFQWRIAGGLAALVFAAHVVTNLVTPYGIHRDEFLYFAMGDHLRLFGMEFPPAIALLANLERAVGGDGLVALRLVPALVGAVLVLLAALAARMLGGRRFAQGLAALTVALSPMFLRAGNLFQPVVLDQLWWTLGFLALVALGTRVAPRAWLLLGVAVGLGALTKFSIGFFALGAAAGVLATPLRRALGTRWPWIAVAAAVLLGAPSVIGQIRLGWPVVGSMADLRATQLVHVTAAGFVGGQLLWGPVVLVGWVGLAGLFLDPALRAGRAAGWAALAAFLTLLLLHGKSYYIAPIYPTLAGAGAVVLERWRRRGAAVAVRVVTVAATILLGLIGLPISLPILAPAPLMAWGRAIHAEAAFRTNRGTMGELPQDFADMLGWPEQAAAVARVFHALPDSDRADAVIWADNYGEAGALEFYGPRLGLPPVKSAAGSFWFFGPGSKPGRVLVTLGADRPGLERVCTSVQDAGRVENPLGVAEEQDVPIFVCRGLHPSLQALWPSLAGAH